MENKFLNMDEVGYFQLQISDQLFKKFSQFIYDNLGIHMNDSKKVMLQARLISRIRQLKLKSFEDYFDYVTSKEGLQREMPNMVNAVTTNKTEFFREPKHFEYLTDVVLPEFYQHANRSKFKIWSAACSIGAEPYTLAMILQEFAVSHPGFAYSILSTDISTEVLDVARNAIYNFEMADSVPSAFRKKYLLKTKDPKKQKLIRIIPELRNKVKFKQLNLMAPSYSVVTDIDVIFCRNVFIYFDRKTQNRVFNKLCRHLRPGGYIFMGHSETIRVKNPSIKCIKSTIHQKKTES